MGRARRPYGGGRVRDRVPRLLGRAIAAEPLSAAPRPPRRRRRTMRPSSGLWSATYGCRSPTRKGRAAAPLDPPSGASDDAQSDVEEKRPSSDPARPREGGKTSNGLPGSCLVRVTNDAAQNPPCPIRGESRRPKHGEAQGRAWGKHDRPMAMSAEEASDLSRVTRGAVARVWRVRTGTYQRSCVASSGHKAAMRHGRGRQAASPLLSAASDGEIDDAGPDGACNVTKVRAKRLPPWLPLAPLVCATHEPAPSSADGVLAMIATSGNSLSASSLEGPQRSVHADPDCRGAAFDRTEKWRGVGGSPAAASISVLPACAAARACLYSTARGWHAFGRYVGGRGRWRGRQLLSLDPLPRRGVGEVPGCERAAPRSANVPSRGAREA